jgi:integrase
MKPDNNFAISERSPKLLDQVRDAIRIRHYSIRTEEAYVQWIRSFIRFHGLRHPMEMGAREVTVYLSHLATERDVAAATQQQALSALLFLYRHVLEINLPWLDDLVRPKKPARLPTVLNQDEVSHLLDAVRPDHALMALLIYGTGMRLMECLRLRVKDIDFTRREIIIRDGKGAKDRVTVLPLSLIAALQGHWPWPVNCLTGTALQTGPASICRMHWSASTRMRGQRGHGFGCFRRRVCRSIRAAASSAAIMLSTKKAGNPRL